MERTLIIIKPDAVQRNLTAKILDKFLERNIRIVAIKSFRLTKKQAEQFYYVHKGKNFFEILTDYISSGVIICAVLEAENVIERVREIMGKTNPKEAAPGTIRAEWGIDITKNSVHGSDSKQSADYEISFFFSKLSLN